MKAIEPHLLLLALRKGLPGCPTVAAIQTVTSGCAHPSLLSARHSSSSSSSSSTNLRSDVAITFPAVCIWGANTGVGKTLVSAGLVAAAVRNQVAVQYIKPVQTGFPQDSDSRLVAAAAAAGSNASAARQLLRGTTTLYAFADPVSPHLAAAAEGRVLPDAAIVAGVAAQLRHFTAALIRDLSGGGSWQQQQGQQQQQQWQQQWQARGLSVVETAGGVTSPGPSGTLQGDLLRPLALPALLVGDHALGGISTTLSAYESLLLRGGRVAAVVMMDDGRLRNVEAVAQHLQHAAAHRLGQALPVVSLPLCRPPPRENSGDNSSGSSSGSAIDAELAAWLAASAGAFDALLALLQQQHAQRLAWLGSAASRAASTVWWPFTQHAQLPDRDVTVVEGRAGEDWLVYKQQQQQQQPSAPASTSSTNTTTTSSSGSSSSGSSSSGDVLTPLHDAAGSWWTQTASTPRQQLEVVRALAAAAGGYMHVMWPQVAHAPGLALTEALLHSPTLNPGGWASRVFYSDDGSTAIEVALKMAFRKYLVDHSLTGALLQQQQQQQQQGQQQQQQQGSAAAPIVLEVLSLANAYHGDTLGAMDCAAPSPFNGPRQTPWYRGRGLFLEPPYLALVAGSWTLRPPAWLQQPQPPQQQHGPGDGSSGSNRGGGSSGGGSSSWSWGSQAEAMDVVGRSSSELAQLYRRHIDHAIDSHEAAAAAAAAGTLPSSATTSSSSSSSSSGAPRVRLGALLMEPVLQGAGGMLLVDPLFQAALVQAARARRIPVIFDEVFTGCWRTGPATAGALLGGPPDGCRPDIAAYGKLLTGGVAPLAATLASEAVFDAFAGDTKAEALLHGHSYTAYPLGCAAAMASLALLQDAALNPNLCTPAVPGRCRKETAAGSGGCCSEPCGRLLPVWDEGAAARLSRHPRVAGVVVLGSVLAVELAAAAGPGSSDGSGGGSTSTPSSSGAGRYGSAAAVDVVGWLRQRGIAARPLGPVVYLMAAPTAEAGRCAWLLGQLEEVLQQEEDAWAAAAAAAAAAGPGGEEGVLI